MKKKGLIILILIGLGVILFKWFKKNKGESETLLG